MAAKKHIIGERRRHQSAASVIKEAKRSGVSKAWRSRENHQRQRLAKNKHRERRRNGVSSGNRRISGWHRRRIIEIVINQRA